MMNVPATNVDIVKGADVVEVYVGKCPGDSESDEKSDGCEEQAAPGPVGNMFVKKFTDARMAQHQERDASRNRHEKQKEPRFYGHALLKPRDTGHKWAGVDYEEYYVRTLGR